MATLAPGFEDIAESLLRQVEEFEPTVAARSVGTVISVGDGIALADGLADVKASEIVDLLKEQHEKSLMTTLSRFPEVIELAANNRAPQHLVHYLRDLANEFHTYYNAHTFIVDDDALRNARLALITATRTVIASGLKIIGVSAPDSM